MRKKLKKSLILRLCYAHDLRPYYKKNQNAKQIFLSHHQYSLHLLTCKCVSNSYLLLFHKQNVFLNYFYSTERKITLRRMCFLTKEQLPYSSLSGKLINFPSSEYFVPTLLFSICYLKLYTTTLVNGNNFEKSQLTPFFVSCSVFVQ